jgi:tRNA pseudouridine55 synthase
MDGLLVVDKPVGPTSHDVVARVRRLLGERRIGHTGTLDPSASGVLPLVIGRATRLARFLSSAEKSYRATIRLGVETDTFDGAGTAAASFYTGPLPDREMIDRALDAFRGEFSQRPPAYSAKKIDGKRSHRLARRAAANPALPASPASPARPASVRVTARRLELVDVDGDCVTLHVDCSAGFYVRTLAHDLGARLGTGAHLAGLRRLQSGELALVHAVPLETLEAHPERARAAVIPLAQMLPSLESLHLTRDGAHRARHGRDLGAEDFTGGLPSSVSGEAAVGADSPFYVRLVDPAGDLLGLAAPARTPGLLHPLVVLM